LAQGSGTPAERASPKMMVNAWLLALFITPVWGAQLNLHTRVHTSVALKARVPAFDSVLTMLQNLITQIDAEAQSDETDYGNFMTWFEKQSVGTESSIGSLTVRLQELAAVLAGLRSRQHKLSGEVARLNGEIEETQESIAAATAKRTEEHESFVKEQLDFDNSIAACNKAVELLTAHFGDGSPPKDTKPAWMSLMQTLETVKRVAVSAGRQIPEIQSFIESTQTPGMRGSQMNDVYEGVGDTVSGDGGIVGQVKMLASTFADDKQSSIDQENELTAAFTTLMTEKTAQLATLIEQRDAQQAILTQVNQEIGENENAEATAKATLMDEQAYLSTIKQQEVDTSQLYTQRKLDRAEEKQAVNMAITTLSQEAPSSLLQTNSKTRMVAKMRIPCPTCTRAASLLKMQAVKLKSELLATAAMTTGSGEALVPVIAQLTDLIHRLDEQQQAEQDHKDWCEHELSETGKAKTHHEGMVVGLKDEIEDTNAVIAEKQQSIKDTMDAIAAADSEMEELTHVREQAKKDFDTEHADYVDAISALNQAIDILADFYREGGAAFIQLEQKQVPVPDAADRAMTPSMGTLNAGYQKKGGGHVVSILKDTRTDFEAGKHHLEAQEEQQIADYEASKAAYAKNRADLVDAGNRLNAELQTAQLGLAQAQTDLADNEEKVASLTSYLGQVGGSCTQLIDSFADRTRLRNEEKSSITEAVKILQSAA